jgi:primary-amine oxidase
MSSTAKRWVVISASIAFIFFIITASVPFIKHVKTGFVPSGAPAAGSFRASKNNVWVDLSSKEAKSIVNFLFKRSELNLTKSSEATRSASAHELRNTQSTDM